MGAQLCPMEIIKMYLHRNSSAPHLLRSLYLHLHPACLRGHPLLRLDMAVPKASFLPVSILLSSKASPHRLLRLLQVLVLHLGLGHLLAKDLHPECRLDFNSQVLEGLGNMRRSEEYYSSVTMRKKWRDANERISCRHDMQHQMKPVLLTNEVSEHVLTGQHV